MRNQEREAAWAKRLVRAAEWLEAIEAGKGAKVLEDSTILEVRIKTSARPEGDTLMILKAAAGDQTYVAFVGARTIVEALLTWRQKEGAAGVKWREDRPWRE